MRDALIPQMIETLGYNHAHGTQTAALFEMGRVFFKNDAGQAVEEDRVCAAVMGVAGRSATDQIRAVKPGEAIRWLKGALESLADALHAPPLRVAPGDRAGLEPGLAATILLADKPVGVIGMVARETCRKWRIASPVVVAEIRRDALLGNVFNTVTARDVPTFPPTHRDIALVAGPGATHEQIVGVIRKAAPAELREIRLFDIFSGPPLGEGKTSLAYRLEYRAHDRTLTDEAANAFHEAVKAALREKLDVELREGTTH